MGNLLLLMLLMEPTLPRQYKDKHITRAGGELGRRYNRVKKAANDGGKRTPKATVDQIDPQFTAERLARDPLLAVEKVAVLLAPRISQAIRYPCLA
ncbi:MAG: hypothetical protein CO107_12435 [Deltaproteobacteria bacterium CG_4_9_14_3_um_filter_51_14]|nr:MAG: hypothetical protein CO107_12435 [Deltaproteobacteria bacterium CG_4_9_14_3_um_filter_51_14]